MSRLTLSDTSTWVNYQRANTDKSQKPQVEQLVSDQLAAMTPLVWVELMQGIRSKEEEATITNLRSLCHWLPVDELCWNKVAQIGIRCVRKGVNVPTSDVIIQGCALRHDVELLHCDHHFDLIQGILT